MASTPGGQAFQLVKWLENLGRGSTKNICTILFQIGIVVFDQKIFSKNPLAASTTRTLCRMGIWTTLEGDHLKNISMMLSEIHRMVNAEMLFKMKCEENDSISFDPLHNYIYYVKRPLSKRPKIGFQDQLSLIEGQKYCKMLQREHSAILWPSFSYHLSLRSFLSIFEWPFYTGFTVFLVQPCIVYIRYRYKIKYRLK